MEGFQRRKSKMFSLLDRFQFLSNVCIMFQVLIHAALFSLTVRLITLYTAQRTIFNNIIYYLHQKYACGTSIKILQNILSPTIYCKSTL